MSSSQLPTSTRAWRIHKPGVLSQRLQLDQDVKIPALKTSEALIQIDHAGLNPVDWKMAQLVPGFSQTLPRDPATDFSGKIIALGPKAAGSAPGFDFQVGQDVWGSFPVEKLGAQGSLQDYAIAGTAHIAPRPDNLPVDAAAGLSITGMTALSLARKAKKGDKVLLLGAGTTVGILLADILKSPHVGVQEIVATAGSSKIATLGKRGKIDAFIDYRTQAVEETLKKDHAVKDGKGFDVILDCVGSSPTYDQCPAYLNQKGQYCNVGASFIQPGQSFFTFLGVAFWTLKTFLVPTFLGGVPRKYVMLGPVKGYEGLKEMNTIIENGWLQPIVDQVFEFDDALKAYEKLMSNQVFGKLIVRVKKQTAQ